MNRDEARRRFPLRLRAALAARGVKQAELADLMELRPATISEWCRGVRFPSLEQAAGLVEHLDGYDLANLLTAGHTVACIVCERSVVQTKRTRHPKYCSPACKATHWSRLRMGSRANVGTVAKHRLVMFQEAVGAHCRGCEPEGFCRDADCALRDVSPLQLAKVRAA